MSHFIQILTVCKKKWERDRRKQSKYEQKNVSTNTIFVDVCVSFINRVLPWPFYKQCFDYSEMKCFQASMESTKMLKLWQNNPPILKVYQCLKNLRNAKEGVCKEVVFAKGSELALEVVLNQFHLFMFYSSYNTYLCVRHT